MECAEEPLHTFCFIPELTGGKKWNNKKWKQKMYRETTVGKTINPKNIVPDRALKSSFKIELQKKFCLKKSTRNSIKTVQPK